MIRFKEAVDRGLIADVHAQSVAQRRSLCAEFSALGDAFGRRRSPAGPRRHLLRSVKQPVQLVKKKAKPSRHRPHQRTDTPSVSLDLTADDTTGPSAASEEEQEEWEPLERIVFQFDQFKPPPPECYARPRAASESSQDEQEEEEAPVIIDAVVEAQVEAMQCELAQETHDLRQRYSEYAAHCGHAPRRTTPVSSQEEHDEEDEAMRRELVQQAYNLRERYNEYVAHGGAQCDDAMAIELRSIQTLKIVVGSNTIYCQ